MVDDDDVGGGGALAHLRDVAVVVARALGAEAGIRRRRDFVPERQILGRSSSSARSPVSVRLDQSRIIGRNTSCERSGGRIAVVVELIELVEAKIVRAAFHVGRGERDAERVAQRGNVLEEDLFLEILGAGRNQDAVAAKNRRHEIARASCRFPCRLRRGGRRRARTRERPPSPSRSVRRAARTPASRARADRRVQIHRAVASMRSGIAD